MSEPMSDPLDIEAEALARLAESEGIARERYCLQLLQEHLGFPAPKRLAGEVRKLADSLKKQRGRGQDLFM